MGSRCQELARFQMPIYEINYFVRLVGTPQKETWTWAAGELQSAEQLVIKPSENILQNLLPK